MPNLEMSIQIIRHTPLWVWGLLAALLALGLSQLRERQVPLPRLLILPGVLLALGVVSTASSFVPAGPALAAWATAFAISVAVGQRLPIPAGTAWDADARTLHLPGSVWPLLLIVAVFSLRYVGNVALVLHPAWRQAPEVALPMASAFGVIAGLLLGRVLALRSRVARTMSADACLG